MERYIAVPQLALGAFIAAHAALNRIGAQPALASKWRRDNTCHPFPLTHTSPGREPGDCGHEGNPALHSEQTTPRSLAVPGGALRRSPPACARGFYAAHAVDNTA